MPRLSIARILQMNLGFFGLQFSFGLQQANMGPIYSYLGASEASLPLLQLAGPVTGLLVQPLVGALSDRTASRWGRRTPYFVVGAIMCSLALFLMPLSTSLMMAVSLLWILDAGNNVTMEPYRAYVKDRLIADQQPIGFLSQSAFTGLAQTLAFLTPTLLVHGLGMDKDAVGAHNIPDITRATFIIGAILSLGTMAWSLLRVRERILPERERAQLARLPRSPAAIISEILSAFRAMPDAMRRMMLMSLFQWYAMTCFWAYSAYAIGSSLHGTTAPTSTGFRDAVLMNGQVGAFYNFIAFAAGLALVPLARRRDPMMLHALCLALSAIGMLSFARADTDGMLFLSAIGIGFGWASMMGMPYVLLAHVIPDSRTGIYMGIFNMFIVIPMLLFAVTMPLAYLPLLHADPRNAILLAGLLMLCAAVSAYRIRGSLHAHDDTSFRPAP